MEIRRKESAVGRGVASLSYHHGVQGTPKSRKKEKVQRCRGSKTIALLQKKRIVFMDQKANDGGGENGEDDEGGDRMR